MWRITLFALFFFGSGTLRAQFTPEDSLILRNIPEGKFKMLTDGIYPNDMTHIGRGLLPLPNYYQWKRKQSAQLGLDYVLVLAPIFQWSSSGNYTANLENDLLGKWRIIENEKSNANVSFWFLHIHNLSNLYTGEFSQKEGLALETSLGDVPFQGYTAIMSLWWEHALFNDKLLYRVGHLNNNTIFANNKYINDDRDGFMNSVSSSPVGAQWVGNKSLGATVSFIEKYFYLMAGVQAANGNQRYPDFESLDNGAIVTFEAAVTPTYQSNTAKYGVTVSSQPVGDKHVFSAVVNVRQDILKGKLGLFGRLATNDNAAASVKQGLTAGLYVNSPFKYTSDAVGVAYVNTQPVTNGGGDDGVEVFYRVLLTHRLDVSADWMYYWQTTRANSSHIFSTRLRFIL